MTVSFQIGTDIIDDYVRPSTSEVPLFVRNRNWELVAQSFNLVMSSGHPYTIAKGDILYTWVDSKIRYTGYVNKIIPDFFTKEITYEINNYLFKLDAYNVDYKNLHELIWDTADWSDPLSFTANLSTDEILTLGAPTIGSLVQFKSTGTLPLPLQQFKHYYVVDVDVNGFYVSLTSGGAVIDLSDYGTGTHYYANVGSSKDYVQKDNESCPNLNLKKLFEVMMKKIAASWDFTALDDVMLYAKNISGVVEFTYKTICLDENMLYSLNQNKATNQYTMDNGANKVDYGKNKISCLKLLQEVLSKFGIFCYYEGDETTPIKLIFDTEFRDDTTGVLVPAEYRSFSIPDDDIVDYKYEDLTEEGENYQASQKWTVRGDYAVFDETDISEQDAVKAGTEKNTISLLNNMKFLLRNSTPGNVYDSTTHFIPTSYLIYNERLLLNTSYKREELGFLELSAIKSVLELNLSIDPLQINVKQEIENI